MISQILRGQNELRQALFVHSLQSEKAWVLKRLR